VTAKAEKEPVPETGSDRHGGLSAKLEIVDFEWLDWQENGLSRATEPLEPDLDTSDYEVPEFDGIDGDAVDGNITRLDDTSSTFNVMQATDSGYGTRQGSNKIDERTVIGEDNESVATTRHYTKLSRAPRSGISWRCGFVLQGRAQDCREFIDRGYLLAWHVQKSSDSSPLPNSKPKIPSKRT
jgi:hypothetical protein